MNFEEIIDKFEIDNKSKRVDRVQAKCPCHNDKNASLTISHMGDKTYMYCHAGCETGDILESVGLKMSDLYDQPLQQDSKSNGNIEKIYKFFDENGDLAYEKIRFKGKKFSHRRYENGVEVWGLSEGIYTETFPGSNSYSMKDRPGAKELWFPEREHILYNLPNLIEGVKNGQTVYIVEGEKDADNVIKRGLVATTTSIGATKGDLGKKWLKSFNKYFKGANVVLVPDNDKPGMAFMDHVAKQLKSVANSIKIIELPGLELKGDISDWLEAGNDIYDLNNIVEKTLEYVDFKGNIIYDYNWSDVGNAERLIALHGKDLKYNVHSGKWYVWNGAYWEKDNSYKAENLYRKVLRRFQNSIPKIDLGDDEKTEKAREKAKAFVLRSESDGKIKATINQVKMFEGVNFEDSDSDDFLFNTPNSTIDLKNLKERTHNRNDVITQCAGYSYNPDKTECPNWLKFLDKIFLGDKEIIRYIQKAMGYSLTGTMKENCLFMLWGGGANGKSTFIQVLEAIAGSYAININGETLMETRGGNPDAPRGDLAVLLNKRIAIASELQEGQVFNEPLLKRLTFGEKVRARFMFQEGFDLIPKCKLWIMTNKKPTIKGNDNGIWRRWRLIPFKYSFSDEEKDPDFFEKKLKPELEAIFFWILTGYQMWKEEGLKDTPLEIAEAVTDYKTDMDQVARFMEDCCVKGEDFSCTGSELYEEYNNWCINEGETYKMSNNKFARDLKEKGFINKKTNRGKKWLGIKVNYV